MNSEGGLQKFKPGDMVMLIEIRGSPPAGLAFGFIGQVERVCFSCSMRGALFGFLDVFYHVQFSVGLFGVPQSALKKVGDDPDAVTSETEREEPVEA